GGESVLTERLAQAGEVAFVVGLVDRAAGKPLSLAGGVGGCKQRSGPQLVALGVGELCEVIEPARNAELPLSAELEVLGQDLARALKVALLAGRAAHLGERQQDSLPVADFALQGEAFFQVGERGVVPVLVC